MAQEIYVVIEFDRETHEFSEVEGVFQSKEEAENLVKDHNAKFLRYSYEWFEETYDADEVDAVLAEKDAEIADLKQKLESVQASMYADVVDACMENRRLKRALWLARAWYCGRSSEYFSGMASRCKIGQEYFYKEVNERARRYIQSSYKCRAKAEEYK